VVVTIGLPVFGIPELAWRVEDRSTSRWDSNCRPPIGICAIVVENLKFHGFLVI
jgi:hypothetical protein